MLCAIKLIKRSYLTDANFKQIILEIKLQSFLKHANIVELYQTGVDKEYIYLML